MATNNIPLLDPNPNVDIPPPPDPTPSEDLSLPVPLGEPDDEGYVIEEEDPEYGPANSGA
jgi:hypothetical protein